MNILNRHFTVYVIKTAVTLPVQMMESLERTAGRMPLDQYDDPAETDHHHFHNYCCHSDTESGKVIEHNGFKIIF